MRDQQDGAVIVGDDFLKQVEGFEVEVVGRLVEHEEIGGAGKFAREQQARALAARKRSDQRLGQVGVKQIFLQIALDVLFDAANVDPVAALGEHVADPAFGRHQPTLLIDDDARESLGELDLALIGVEFAGQQPKQGGLSGAVGADDPDPVAALDPEREIVNDDPLGKALGDFFGVDHDLGLGIVAGQAELGRAGGADHRCARGAHLVELGQPALIATATGGDPAFKPVKFELELGVELVRGALLLGIDRLGPGIETAKADLRPAHLSPFEPQATLGQAGEEGSVVADDDEGTGETAEPVFEPVDRGEIEVVGRLVEEQDIGVLGERADDCGPATLPATCGRGRAGEVDAELIGDGRGFVRFGRIAAGEDPVAERAMAGHHRVLFEQDHAAAGNEGPAALVGVDGPGEAFEQRGLACAVAADQCEAVARADMDVELSKQPALALDETEIFERENWGCGHCGPLAGGWGLGKGFAGKGRAGWYCKTGSAYRGGKQFLSASSPRLSFIRHSMRYVRSRPRELHSEIHSDPSGQRNRDGPPRLPSAGPAAARPGPGVRGHSRRAFDAASVDRAAGDAVHGRRRLSRTRIQRPDLSPEIHARWAGDLGRRRCSDRTDPGPVRGLNSGLARRDLRFSAASPLHFCCATVHLGKC